MKTTKGSKTHPLFYSDEVGIREGYVRDKEGIKKGRGSRDSKNRKRKQIRKKICEYKKRLYF